MLTSVMKYKTEVESRTCRTLYATERKRKEGSTWTQIIYILSTHPLIAKSVEDKKGNEAMDKRKKIRNDNVFEV